MQKERGSGSLRSLSLHQEIEREAREIEKEMERHPELDDLQVTEEMDAALLARIRAYEEELEEEREAVKKVEENLRKGHYLKPADGKNVRAGERGSVGVPVRHFKVPGDSVEFSAELMPEIPRGLGLGGRTVGDAGDRIGEAVADGQMGCAGAELTAGSGDTAERVTESAAQSAGEGKILYRRKKRKYLVISLAAVLVFVMGVGVTSVGSKSHWKVMWERVTGREPVKVLNTEDMDSKETDDGKELVAYREIKEKLNINPVRIKYKPDDMMLVDYEIQDEVLKAQLLYKYKDEIIRYFLYMNDSDSSIGQNEEDKKIDEYTVSVHGIEIKVEEFEVDDSTENRQIANFEYLGVHYQLKGIMDKTLFKKILENLLFFAKNT